MAFAAANKLAQTDPVGDHWQSLPSFVPPVWGLQLDDAGMEMVPPKQAGTNTAARLTVMMPGRVVPVLSDRQLPVAEGLIPLQSWEGVVLEVDEDSFSARLADISGEHQDEEVELSKEELSEFDLDLLERGAIFYWTIGYRQRLPNGARERVSRIRFRRLPAWSKAELTTAHERAETLSRELGW
jgi:hypothetical protein